MSIYEASSPVFLRGLENLTAVLKKGVEHAEARGIDPAVLFDARLAPDMFPLSRQVQFVTDGARGCIARLAGVAIPEHPYVEASFDQLFERIAATEAFVRSIPRAQVEAGVDRPLIVSVGGVPTPFVGRNYLYTFALPNLYFHSSIAYAILRHNGVPVGKEDYLGAYPAA
jgi:hypothetical protein